MCKGMKIYAVVFIQNAISEPNRDTNEKCIRRTERANYIAPWERKKERQHGHRFGMGGRRTESIGARCGTYISPQQVYQGVYGVCQMPGKCRRNSLCPER